MIHWNNINTCTLLSALAPRKIPRLHKVSIIIWPHLGFFCWVSVDYFVYHAPPPTVHSPGRLFIIDFLLTRRCKDKFPVRFRIFSIYKAAVNNLNAEFSFNFIELSNYNSILIGTYQIQGLFESIHQDFL